MVTCKFLNNITSLKPDKMLPHKDDTIIMPSLNKELSYWKRETVLDVMRMSSRIKPILPFNSFDTYETRTITNMTNKEMRRSQINERYTIPFIEKYNSKNFINNNDSISVINMRDMTFYKGVIFNHFKRTYISPIKNMNYRSPAINYNENMIFNHMVLQNAIIIPSIIDLIKTKYADTDK